MANRGAVCRSANDSEALNPPKKNMEQYVKTFEINTSFMSTYHPDVIEAAILEHLRTVAKVEP
jgi:hypothetical protein